MGLTTTTTPPTTLARRASESVVITACRNITRHCAANPRYGQGVTLYPPKPSQLPGFSDEDRSTSAAPVTIPERRFETSSTDRCDLSARTALVSSS